MKNIFSISTKKRLTYFSLLGIAVAAIIGLLWASERGLGLDSDSSHYIDCAANLSMGNGYVTSLYNYYQPIPLEKYIQEASLDGRAKIRPQTHYPPLYSFFIALLSKFGLRPMTGAVVIVVFLFGINIVVVSLLVYRWTHQSMPFAGGAALIMLASESMLYAHTSALTEPLFIFLSLAGLTSISKYIRYDRFRDLILGSLACGLAFLARVPGAMLIATGILGIFLFSRKSVIKKIKASSLLFLVGCSPIAVFFIRNFRLTGNFTNRHPSFNWPDRSAIDGLRSSLSSWILPGSYRYQLFPGQLDIVTFILIVLILASVGWGLILIGKKKRETQLAIPDLANESPILCALYIPIYFGLFLFAEVFIDLKLIPDPRLLAPLFPPSLIVGAFLFHKLLPFIKRKIFKNAVSVLCLTYVFFYLCCGLYWISVCHRNGRGYNSRIYQSPAILTALEKVRALKEGPILTNDIAAVYFQAGRYAYSLSFIGDQSVLESLQTALGNSPVCFVYYKTPIHQKVESSRIDKSHYPIEDILVKTLDLQVLSKDMDISVYWLPARD